jgi:putative PIN family toxin of toxin-antitoxin system
MKVVLDTNVWLDWLVFDDPGMAPLKKAFAEGLFEIVIDQACEAELERVLAYPLRKQPIDAQACLSLFRQLATRVENIVTEEKPRLPRCSDPDDQKFLELALAARVDFLVTKDRALLDMQRRIQRKSGSDPDFSFRIVKPSEFVTECKTSG